HPSPPPGRTRARWGPAGSHAPGPRSPGSTGCLLADETAPGPTGARGARGVPRPPKRRALSRPRARETDSARAYGEGRRPERVPAATIPPGEAREGGPPCYPRERRNMTASTPRVVAETAAPNATLAGR